MPLLFKKLNNKFNINSKLRYILSNLYLDTRKNFYTKSEMILFYIGISLCSGFYIVIIKNIYFVQHVLFDMYPVFWTPAFELNNYFFIKDASLNLEGGIHFDFAWILLLL